MTALPAMNPTTRNPEDHPMTTTTPQQPLLLTPTGDPQPLEDALVHSIAAGLPRETFLWITMAQPDGGVRIRYAWTDGGTILGDRVDLLAIAEPLDATDWLHITDRHVESHHRGRIRTDAYPLRPILADVASGVRAPDERRDAIRRVILAAGHLSGQRPTTLTPPWFGVGPALLGAAP
ncbi:hypothetical protein [Streptomyces sp. NPDC050738]|uniref:hypothetical protein n=1 Tax=Streptomyces sp. NPDC050738 TaxID=3154744 RepID=UPI00341DFEF8